MGKRNRILLVLAGAVTFLGTLWIVGRLGSPQTLSFEVSGEPGRKIVGTVDVDGMSQPVAGILPTRFEYRGSRIEYAIASVNGESGEQITVKTSVDGRPSYECVGSGVKGSISRQGVPGGGNGRRALAAWQPTMWPN